MDAKQAILLGVVAATCLIVGAGLSLTVPFLTDVLATCNVARIPLHGTLYTYPTEEADEYGTPTVTASSDEIVWQIENAEYDPAIRGIVLDVDSYGGSIVAAQEVAERLWAAEIPTVALIRESGISAAYWASLGADAIIASRHADIGGVGVLYSHLSNAGRNEAEGLEYEVVSSGRFKTLGDPNVPLSGDMRALLQRDIDIIHAAFVDALADARGLDHADALALADGSTMLGEMAMEEGLIDAIGNNHTVAAYFEDVLGEPVMLCY